MSAPDEAAVGRLGRLWILTLCGYSLLLRRASPGRSSPATGSTRRPSFLDVVTAHPLALGRLRIVAAFRAQDFAAAQRWCGVAGAAFLTPYAYLFLAGHAEMPGYATALLGVLVAVMATASVLRVRQQCLGCEAAVLEPALALADD